MLNALVMVLLFLTAVFLILLVLIQRGRGGGLAGAFGGLGGQSAFGTKAGDLFTRITIGVAAFWIILCAASVKLLSNEDSALIDPNIGKNAASIPAPAGGTTTDAKTEPGAAGGGKSAPAKTAPADATPQSSAPEASASDSGTPAGTPATSAPEGGSKADPPK